MDALELELLGKLDVLSSPLTLSGAFQGFDPPPWALDTLDGLLAGGLVEKLPAGEIALTDAGRAALAAAPVPYHAIAQR